MCYWVEVFERARGEWGSLGVTIDIFVLIYEWMGISRFEVVPDLFMMFFGSFECWLGGWVVERASEECVVCV